MRGNVSRVVGAASTATLTLRNPYKMWVQVGNPIFHPMDQITIWLSRYRNYPVQVFTGYLDRTPYLQLYPGTVTLQASCTLKRLLHTYWDPALPFTTKFLQKFGWLANPQTGQLQNLAAQAAQLGKDGHLTDGSIGRVLYEVLTEKQLGNWDPSEIFIEQLPSDIIGFVKRMYENFSADQDELDRQLTTLFSQIIGGGSHGTGGTGQTVAASGTITGIDKIVPGLEKAANDHGIPPVFVITTWLVEGAQTDASHPNGSGARGYFQFTSATPYSFYTNKPIDYPKDAGDLAKAADLFCGAAKWQLDRNKSFGNEANWQSWAENTQQPGHGAYNNTWNDDLALAKSYYAQYGSESSSSILNPNSALPSGSSNATSPAVTSGSGKYGMYSAPFPKGTKYTQGRLDQGYDIEGMPVGTPVLSMTDGTVIDVRNNEVGGDPHNGAGFGPNYPIIKVSGGPLDGRLIYYGHVNPCVVQANDKVKAGQKIAEIQFITQANGGHIEIGFDDPLGTVAPPSGGPMKAVVDEIFANGSDFGTVAPGGGGSSGNVLDQSTAAAFAAQVAWPSLEEQTEAIGLSGAKSLMNDQQLMPFIQQLTTASMRQFQSLPNGDFFAFFPDYFGDFKHRKAYWQIEDIEILDGKIELTDDALATHVYTVGDTGVPLDGINFVDKIMSGGVMTIFEAFRSGFVLGDFNGKGERSHLLSEKGAAVSFLQKYGARPYYEEVPQIRSPYYEAFYAFQTFQLLWSRTFLTEFQFTFMPEVYPGGIVAFPQHSIQCYVDSVSHDFDYESGFTTTAQLSAPAAYGRIANSPVATGLIRANAGSTP